MAALGVLPAAGCGSGCSYPPEVGGGTYSTVAIIDVRGDDTFDAVKDAVRCTAIGSREKPVGDGWRRMIVQFGGIEWVDDIQTWLAAFGVARAAISEDDDEFGAQWVVLAAEGGTVRTVHRRYLLNADPNDPAEVKNVLSDFEDGDPRRGDVAGAPAARAAAALFDQEPGPMVAVERATKRAHGGSGVVQQPLPWWEALALPWLDEGD
jgi:hypothetical protein